MFKKLLAVVGLVGTLGSAAPAFADWYGPDGSVVVTPPGNYYADRWRDRDDWRWRRHRAHEWREREWRGREHHRW